MSNDADVEIQQMFFEVLSSDLSGQPFQDWFENLMKVYDPYFIPIGHEGIEGDHACDGFSTKTGRFYQVYAPTTLKEDLNKVERDFKRAVYKWGNRIKEWIFLHGKMKVKPRITKLVIDLANENGIEVVPWSNTDLWNILLEIPRDDRVKLLGMPSHFKDQPMRNIEETNRGVQELLRRKSISDSVREKVVESRSPISVDQLKEVHNQKDDVSRKKILLEGISSINEESIRFSLDTASKLFPDDFEITSAISYYLSKWTDQTVEHALYYYLAKSKDNRVPDIVLEVAKEEHRRSNFRESYFRLLGEEGRSNQIEDLKELVMKERNEIVKRSISAAIRKISEKTPSERINTSNSFSLRLRIEFENLTRRLSSGNFPMLNLVEISHLIDQPNFGAFPLDFQERILYLKSQFIEYNELRKKADQYIRFHPPGDPYPIPEKYVGFVAEVFVRQLSSRTDRLIREIQIIISILRNESETGADLLVEVKDVVHTIEGGHYIHYLSLNLTNPEERWIRIGNVKIVDIQGHELILIPRGHTGKLTEFDLRPHSSITWSAFYTREQELTEPNHMKLRIAFEEVGWKTHWYNVVSIYVPPEKFPSGEWFRSF